MMMKMLEAGGVPILTDEVRTADVDNPEGYYEYERVKDLEKETDKSWVRRSRGKALKVISYLLEHLPDDNFYRVVFMRRHLDEIVASQNKMLDHRDEQDDLDDQRSRELFERHLPRVKAMLRVRNNFEFLEVDYNRTLTEPEATARRIDRFLGGGLRIEPMSEVVDPDLYRNRKEMLTESA